MITARFENEDVFTTVSDVVFQWDYGQVLEIEGLNLDEATEVDFATTAKYGEAISVIGEVVDGNYQVKIPDSVLAAQKKEDYTVYAYTFREDVDSGETTHCIKIPVKCRPYRANPDEGGGGSGGGGGGTGTGSGLMYGVCSTAATTTAKVVACDGFTLDTGSAIVVRFTVTNSADSPTLNVNSTGARYIYYRGAAIEPTYLAAGRVYMFIYDGAQYELVGDINTGITARYSSSTKTLTLE